MSSVSGCTTTAKCSKCQKEIADDADLCKDCDTRSEAKEIHEEKGVKLPKAEGKTENCVKMELDRDLTTTETLEDEELDEQDDKTNVATTKQSQSLSLSHSQSLTLSPQKEQEVKPKTADQPTGPAEQSVVRVPSPATIKAEIIADADVEAEQRPTKTVAASHTPTVRGGGKITRSSLNGARSPQIMKRLRKSTRSTRFKSKLTGRGGPGGAGAGGAANGHNGAGGSGGAGGGAGNASGSTAGGAGKSHGKLGGSGANCPPGGARNRRTLFKRPAQKTPRVQACTRFVKSVFYKGSYMQIGDIVSIVDSEQCVYYAQIRGLLVDAYCEKSAFLTWLIPTQDSPDPKDGFDPATYLIGPDEELSRKLCYLEFIMHAPSNYYFDRTTPFPLPDADEYTAQRTGGFIWTRLPVFKRERERERERVGKAAA